MNYRGILFDKDGTLLDFNRTWLPIYLHAANEFADGDPALAAELLSCNGFDPLRNRFLGGSLLAAGNNHQVADAWAQQLQQPDQVESIIRDGLESGEIPSGDPRILAWQFVALMEVALSDYADQVLPDTESKLNQVMNLFFGSVP